MREIAYCHLWLFFVEVRTCGRYAKLYGICGGSCFDPLIISLEETTFLSLFVLYNVLSVLLLPSSALSRFVLYANDIIIGFGRDFCG